MIILLNPYFKVSILWHICYETTSWCLGGKTDRRVEIFKRNIRLKNLVKVRDEEGRNAWPDETYSVEQVDNVFGLFIV